MTKPLDSFERNNPVSDSHKDPLGEQRAAAKRFWLEDGSPENADWSKYWQMANHLFAGDTGIQMNLKDHSKDSVKSLDISTKLEGKGPLIIALAGAVSASNSEHEAFCMAMLLSTSIVAVADNVALGPHSIDEVKEILEELNSIEGIQINAEMSSKILDRIKSDSALSNHDRTTIARITQKLLRNKLIHSIIPVRETVAVVETASGDVIEKKVK